MNSDLSRRADRAVSTTRSPRRQPQRPPGRLACDRRSGRERRECARSGAASILARRPSVDSRWVRRVRVAQSERGDRHRRHRRQNAVILVRHAWETRLRRRSWRGRVSSISTMLDARRSAGLLGTHASRDAASWRGRVRSLAALARMRPRTALLAIVAALLLYVLASDGRRGALVERVESHTTHRPRHSRPLSTVNASHFFERDGLLYSRPVPSDQRALHPIHHLLAKARADWHGKVRRQSRSLEEARREYTRRYGREPPPGYAAWYQFATQHGVILIDEFDQVERDLLPLRGLPPRLLRERAATLIDDTSNYYHTGSFTLHVVDGKLVNVSGPHAQNSRADDRACSHTALRSSIQRSRCLRRSSRGSRTCA